MTGLLPCLRPDSAGAVEIWRNWPSKQHDGIKTPREHPNGGKLNQRYSLESDIGRFCLQKGYQLPHELAVVTIINMLIHNKFKMLFSSPSCIFEESAYFLTTSIILGWHTPKAKLAEFQAKTDKVLSLCVDQIEQINYI